MQSQNSNISVAIEHNQEKIQGPEISNLAGVSNKELVPQRSMNKFQRFLKNTFTPDSVDQENGVPRIIFLDFLRGISIFFMLPFHEMVRNMTIGSSFKEMPLWLIIVCAPFLLPLVLANVLFDPLRGIFAYVSGASTTYGFFKNNDHKSLKKQTIAYLQYMLAQIVLLPFFYYFAWFAEYTIKLSRSEVSFPFAGLHFWQVTPAKAEPILFFGYSNIIHITVEFIISVILQLCGLKDNKLRYWRAQISFLLGNVLITLNSDIIKGLNIATMNYFSDFPFSVDHWSYCLSSEFYSQYYNNQPNFKRAFYLHFTQMVGGAYMPLFPFIQYTLCGSSLGDFLIILIENKQKDYRNYKKYQQDFWRNYKLHILISVLMIPINFTIMGHYISTGQQDSWFFYHFTSVRCMTQELVSFHIFEIEIIVVLSILVTDNCTLRRAAQKANYIFSLRMFSTYSLTFFSMNAVLGMIIRQFLWSNNSWWGTSEKTTNVLSIVLYIIVFQLFCYSFACILNSCHGNMSVESLIKFIADLLRGKKGRCISDTHMKSKIILINENRKHRIDGEVFENERISQSCLIKIDDEVLTSSCF